MRWCVSIGAVLAAGAMAWGDVAAVAAPGPTSQQADTKDNVPSVDLELVIAVDISYSMDMDELAVQREGYAQAIVSKEFLQAIKSGPNSKVAVTYFEWSASSDQSVVGSSCASLSTRNCTMWSESPKRTTSKFACGIGSRYS